MAVQSAAATVMSETETKEPTRPRSIDDVTTRDLLDFGEEFLTPVERFQIKFVRRTFESVPFDRAIRLFQRHIGANWIEQSIKNLRHVHGLDRLPRFDRDASTILVSNHRSFF